MGEFGLDEQRAGVQYCSERDLSMRCGRDDGDDEAFAAAPAGVKTDVQLIRAIKPKQHEPGAAARGRQR